MFGIYQIDTKLGIERKDSIVNIFDAVATVTISTIFIVLTGMAKIAVFAVIPVIGVFAILIVALENMRNRTLLEKLPSLIKKVAREIEIGRGRSLILDPFISFPNRINAIRTKNRDNLLAGFVAFPFVQIPLRPKSPEILKTILRQNFRQTIAETEFRAQSTFMLRNVKFFSRNAAFGLHMTSTSTGQKYTIRHKLKSITVN